MMGVEQERFIALVTDALGQYAKTPTAKEFEYWWAACRTFAFPDIERALKDHQNDSDDGKRAPRPVDVTRRLRAGTRSGSGCAAHGAAGNCQYPGIFSSDTHGSTTWWCPWHFTDSSGPEAERWIQVSHEVPYEVAAAKRKDRMLAEAIRAPGVVETAHAIARRHGDRPWQGKRFSVSPNGRVSFNEEAA